MNHIQPFEVLWVALSTLVVLFHISTLLEVLRDRKAVRLSKRNGAMMLLVRAGTWKESTRLAGQAMLLLAGVAALMTPSPDCVPQMTLTRVLTLTFLIGFQVIMLLNSVLETATRHKLRELEDGAR